MIRLSAHAREVMAVRRIALEWIVETVEHPVTVRADPDDPSLLRSYRPIAEAGGRSLRVVHRALGSDMLVVTAFLDRGAKA